MKIPKEKINDLTRGEVEYWISQCVYGRHYQRNREILKRRFLLGQKLEPLAEAVGLSVRQVQYIIDKELNKIYKKLK